MIISKLLKYILYYFVLKIIYKFVKKYKSIYNNEDINIETVYSDNLSNNNLNECTTLVLYKQVVDQIPRKKYNLKNIYNNFFNGIKEDVKNDINPSHLKTEFKKRDTPNTLLKDIKTDFIIDKDNLNELIWSFETKSEYLYKIKTYLKLNSENACESIELTIRDIDGNAFIYNYILHNIDEDSVTNIYNFSFILDNNEFGDNNITIKLNLGDSEKIDSCMIEVIDKKLEKSVEQTPILIFDVNDRYTPIYFNEKNILDIDEFEGDDFE
jgi:hypothetical protein